MDFVIILLYILLGVLLLNFMWFFWVDGVRSGYFYIVLVNEKYDGDSMRRFCNIKIVWELIW